jgi:hypothetical protein
MEDIACVGWAEFARRLELAKLISQVQQLDLY